MAEPALGALGVSCVEVRTVGGYRLELHREIDRADHLDVTNGLRQRLRRVRGADSGGIDRAPVLSDPLEIDAHAVGVELVALLQHVVGGAGEGLVEAVLVGLALRADAEPLLVHVVAVRGPVEHVCFVRPARRLVVNVEVDLLVVLPPAVDPLERHAADRVACTALAVAVLVDFLPE